MKIIRGLVIIAMLQFLSGAMGQAWGGSQADDGQIASAIQASLDQKLGKPVVITQMINEMDSIFGRRYLAWVSPEGEPGRIFYATYNLDTGIVKDTYIATVVADEFSLEVRKAAATNWPDAHVKTSVTIPSAVLKGEYGEAVAMEDFIAAESPLISTRVLLPVQSDQNTTSEADKLYRFSCALADANLDAVYIVDYVKDVAKQFAIISNGDESGLDEGRNVSMMAAFQINAGRPNKTAQEIKDTFYGVPFVLDSVLSLRPFDTYTKKTTLADGYKHEELFVPYSLVSKIYRLETISDARLTIHLDALGVVASEVMVVGLEYNHDTREYYTAQLTADVLNEQTLEMKMPSRAFAIVRIDS